MTLSPRTPFAGRLHEMAAPFAGVLLADEFRAAGVSRSAVRRLIDRGWLTMIRRGAYLVGGGEPSAWQLLVAAYRLAGPNALVSHWSAARLHRLPVASESFGPELTIVGGGDRRIGGVKIHRGAVPLSEITDLKSVRATTPTRTLRDIAPQLNERAVEALVDEGLIAGHWTIGDLVETLCRAPQRAPLLPLREIVALRSGHSAAITKVESPLELRVARALAACGPFETGFQVVVEGKVFLLDIAWPRLFVAVESEGWDVRSKSRSKFDRERRKFNLLVAHGWTVLHVTATMSDDEIRDLVVPVLLRAAGRVGVSG